MRGPASALRQRLAHRSVAVVGRSLVAWLLAVAASMVFLISQLRIGDRADELAFRQVFAFSIVHLFSLFAVYVVQKKLTAEFGLS